jgi:hypothetical protein
MRRFHYKMKSNDLTNKRNQKKWCTLYTSLFDINSSEVKYTNPQESHPNEKYKSTSFLELVYLKPGNVDVKTHLQTG